MKEVNSGDGTKTAKKALLDSYKNRGFIKSFEVKEPIKFDRPYPLLTNPFMDWLMSWDLSGLTYLEIGSGASTKFLMKHFKDVTSIEPDLKYYEYLKDSGLDSNVVYKNQNELELEAGNFSVDQYYDFCLIDCNLNRFSLMTNILKKTKFAYLIFDSTEWFPNTTELIRDSGYSTQIDFWGFKNSQNWESSTSVFINDSIKLRLNKINRFPAPGAVRLYEKNNWDIEKLSTD
jgi:hypothetical protein